VTCIQSDECVSVVVNAGNPCEGGPVQLTSNEGTIYSPGYDDGVYPNRAHCRWLIKASGGNVRHISMGFVIILSLPAGNMYLMGNVGRCPHEFISLF